MVTKNIFPGGWIDVKAGLRIAYGNQKKRKEEFKAKKKDRKKERKKKKEKPIRKENIKEWKIKERAMKVIAKKWRLDSNIERKSLNNTYLNIIEFLLLLSPCEQSEGSKFNRRKNPHTPVYGVKEFVCLSVCQSVLFGRK